MKKTFSLLLIVLLSFITTIKAQQTFEKVFGGLGNGEWQSDLKEIKGKGYLILGSTNNFGAGNYDAYCIRLDKAGKMLWSKTYGTSLSESDTRCWITSDGGFVLLFQSFYPENEKNSSVFVVKCDANGSIQWSKCIKNPNTVSVIPKYIYESKAGEYYLLCDWYSNIYYQTNFILLKLNHTGELIWEKSINTKPSLFYFISTQILETDEGNIITAGYSQGDNWATYGSYVHLFLFSKKTGAVKQSKRICSDNCEQHSFLYPYNFSIYDNKLQATLDNSGKICWFSAKPYDTQVEGKYIVYNNFHSYQYLINKKFIKQPEGGFYSNLLFTKDGGYLYAYRYTAGSPTYYDIIVDKYDSLGRICPKFEVPGIDTTIHDATFYISEKSYSLLKDSLTIRDSLITVTDVTAQRTICNGNALSITNRIETLTNIITENSSKPGLQLYPNPATDLVTISFEMSKAATIQIEIINAEGKIVLTKQLFAPIGKQQTTLNIQTLPLGAYYIKIIGLNKPTAIQFLKTK